MQAHVKTGRAYALFHSRSPLGDVRRELNDMKEAAGKLDALAIHTYGTNDAIQKGNGTGIPPSIAALAVKNGSDYVIKAVWNGQSNEHTASALDDVLRVASEFFVPEQARIYYGRNSGLNLKCIELG